MKASIREHHEKSRSTYRARRIQKKLAEDAKTVSRRRTGRLMDEEGLECKMRRKFKATTNSKHNKPVAPNLLDRNFTTSELDQAYIGDTGGLAVPGCLH